MGSYSVISLAAMLCYCFLMLIFLSAKKDKLVISFLVVLAALLCWTGGSMLMRAQFWPHYIFWYHVSLLGLLLIPFSYYIFVSAFAGLPTGLPAPLYLVCTAILMLINIPTGLFLRYPSIVNTVAGVSFVYDEVKWPVAILFGVTGIMILKVVLQIIYALKSNHTMRQQLTPVVVGLVILFVGNLALMLPIFQGFPIDILSGVINVGFLVFALIRRHLFRLKLLLSGSLGYAVGLVFACAVFANSSEFFILTSQRILSAYSEYWMIAYAIFFLIIALSVTTVWHAIIRNVVVKDEIQQAERLRDFSQNVSKTLDLDEIMSATIDVIREIMNPESVYICMQKAAGEPFCGSYSDRPLNDLSISLSEDNPLISWLASHDEPILYNEFRTTVEYRSMWESEKNYMDKIGLQCCAAIKESNELRGVVFLTRSSNKGSLNYGNLQVLSSVVSVCGIAVKNARMYEQARLEARTDEMTGLLNRKYFYEILNREFEKQKDGSLVLAIFNVDDFKLYNQLYGVREADRCLKNIAAIISSTVGGNGYCARYSGKEFAILLPRYDLYSANKMAETISSQIFHLNDHREQEYKLKSITVSVGISAAPYAAKTVKELVDSADMAVYHVKHSGKNGIQVFDTKFENSRNVDSCKDHVQVYQEYETTIYALTAAIDAKDHYTFSHSNNVAYYATELARNLGMNDDMIEVIRQAALLHDVGKIGIPENVLNKNGRLTDEEYDVIKGHVAASIGIIRHLPSLDYVIPAVLGHHERYDGMGYPRRISGNDIPATARILCIADSFDAITSKRCYKLPIPLDRAREIMLQESGAQFDPDYVRIFVQCLVDGRIHLVEGEYSA